MLSAMKPMQVSVNNSLLSAAQLGLIGNREDIRRIEQQDPDWEAARMTDQEVELVVRLSISNSDRQNVLTTHKWLARVGSRPTTFLETAAIKIKMNAVEDDHNLVCVGSLWKIEGDYYYACWHDGEVHLYPYEHPFGPDFVCPIVRGEGPLDLPPEMQASLATI